MLTYNKELTDAQRDELYEEVLDDLIEGLTYKKICKKRGFKLSTLHFFLYQTPERSARTREVLLTSSHSYAEKAEQVLINAKGKNMAEQQRARELAHHYRWMSKARAPKIYGEKVELSGDGEAPLKVITGMVVK